MQRQIKKIIIHCSDSPFGDVPTIDRWHKECGWSGIGYNYVIPNGILKSSDRYNASKDGIIQVGRAMERAGAHCKGHNGDSIGVCLIGKYHFTSKQLLTLRSLLQIKIKKYELSVSNIYGHNALDNKKTCPNIDTEFIRDLVRQG